MSHSFSPRSGRPKGATHHFAKLSEQDVQDIKQRLRNGAIGNQLAKEYGVTRSNISLINVGKIWKEIIVS